KVYILTSQLYKCICVIANIFMVFLLN
ncbi:hypothetical protein, partial [Plasmodium yoelii yoelii]